MKDIQKLKKEAKEVEKAIEEFCNLVDQMEPVSEYSPYYNLHVRLKKIVKDYREGPTTTRCEHSGIEWDKDGKVGGVNP
jgi:hypothetical protein